MFGSQRYNLLASTFSVPTVGGVRRAHAQTISASLSFAHAPTRTRRAAAKPRPPGLFKHRVCFTLHQYQLIEEPRSKRGNSAEQKFPARGYGGRSGGETRDLKSRSRAEGQRV